MKQISVISSMLKIVSTYSVPLTTLAHPYVITALQVRNFFLMISFEGKVCFCSSLDI